MASRVGKILNPATGRYVKVDGKIGKQLIGKPLYLPPGVLSHIASFVDEPETAARLRAVSKFFAQEPCLQQVISNRYREIEKCATLEGFVRNTIKSVDITKKENVYYSIKIKKNKVFVGSMSWCVEPGQELKCVRIGKTSYYDLTHPKAVRSFEAFKNKSVTDASRIELDVIHYGATETLYRIVALTYKPQPRHKIGKYVDSKALLPFIYGMGVNGYKGTDHTYKR